MVDTASPLEIIYSLFMLMTFSITVVNVLVAQESLQDLKRTGQNGPVLVLRKGARNDQAKLSGMAFTSVLMGAVALLSPPNPMTTWQSTAFAVVFLVHSGLLAAISISIRLRPSLLRNSERNHG